MVCFFVKRRQEKLLGKNTIAAMKKHGVVGINPHFAYYCLLILREIKFSGHERCDCK